MSEQLSRPVGLIDLDGSVADFDGSMRSKLLEMHGPQEPPLSDDDYDLPHITARRRLIKSQPGFWSGLPALKLGLDVVDVMRKFDFELHVLTKGPDNTESAWSEKKAWAAQHIPDAHVTITQRKDLVYGRVLLDDWPKYVSPWLEVRPRGIVIMVAQPWNEGFRHPRAYRYDGKNFDEIVHAIKDAKQRKET